LSGLFHNEKNGKAVKAMPLNSFQFNKY